MHSVKLYFWNDEVDYGKAFVAIAVLNPTELVKHRFQQSFLKILATENLFKSLI